MVHLIAWKKNEDKSVRIQHKLTKDLDDSEAVKEIRAFMLANQLHLAKAVKDKKTLRRFGLWVLLRSDGTQMLFLSQQS